jgi:hypothetical protein
MPHAAQTGPDHIRYPFSENLPFSGWPPTKTSQLGLMQAPASPTPTVAKALPLSRTQLSDRIAIATQPHDEKCRHLVRASLPHRQRFRKAGA